jgi:hypothetical protein
MKKVPTEIAVLVFLFVVMTGPAFGQIDLTGSWQSRMYEDWIERATGRDLVDYTGLPLNDEARAAAVLYSPSVYSMRERQCLSLSPYVFQFMPQGMRIWSETDADGRIVAWKLGPTLEHDGLTIWMDGRPHPSLNEFYPFSGFTTGKWQGDTLVTYTTHLKPSLVRRGNGSPSSDLATVTGYFTRHDSLLTITTIQEDPVYLTEPFVVSRTFELDPRANLPMTATCYAVTEIPRLEGTGIVPHYDPGQNPEVDYMTKHYNIPREAVMGYAETIYPEYRKKIASTYKIPSDCDRYCCGWIPIAMGTTMPAPKVKCITIDTFPVSAPPAVAPR